MISDRAILSQLLVFLETKRGCFQFTARLARFADPLNRHENFQTLNLVNLGKFGARLKPLEGRRYGGEGAEIQALRVLHTPFYFN